MTSLQGEIAWHEPWHDLLILPQAESNLRASVGGGKDAGITNPPANGALYIPYVSNQYGSVLVPTDGNSLAYARMPAEARTRNAAASLTSHAMPTSF